MDVEQIKSILENYFQNAANRVGIGRADSTIINRLARKLHREAMWNAAVSAGFDPDRKCELCEGPIEVEEERICQKCKANADVINMQTAFGYIHEKVVDWAANLHDTPDTLSTVQFQTLHRVERWLQEVQEIFDTESNNARRAALRSAISDIQRRLGSSWQALFNGFRRFAESMSGAAAEVGRFAQQAAITAESANELRLANGMQGSSFFTIDYVDTDGEWQFLCERGTTEDQHSFRMQDGTMLMNLRLEAYGSFSVMNDPRIFPVKVKLIRAMDRNPNHLFIEGCLYPGAPDDLQMPIPSLYAVPNTRIESRETFFRAAREGIYVFFRERVYPRLR